MARRIRAARALCGWTAQDLVGVIADATPDGQRVPLSIKQLRQIEQETRELEEAEARAIAFACEVPVWFFTTPEHRDLFADQQAALEDLIGQAVEERVAPAVGEVARLADQIADLRDDLVRSDVIKPRTPASPAQRSAIRRLGGAGSRPAEQGPRSQKPGRP